MSSLPFAQTRPQYARKIVIIFLIAVAAIFIIGSLLDFVLLNVIVMSTCEETSSLWRPMNEMMSKMWVMHLTLLVQPTLFVYFYTRFFAEKQLSSASKYDLVWGCRYGRGLRHLHYCADFLLAGSRLVLMYGVANAVGRYHSRSRSQKLTTLGAKQIPCRRTKIQSNAFFSTALRGETRPSCRLVLHMKGC